jgi:hypothetical protein
MDIQIVTVFYLCDKLLEALNTALVAALLFGGNFN